MILKVLLIAHFLGDFTFQSASMAEGKKNSQGTLLLHSVIYAVVMAAACFLSASPMYALLPAAIFAVSHFVIDECKCLLSRKWDSIWLFLIDQAIHIAIIVLVWRFRYMESVPSALMVWARGIPRANNCLAIALILTVNWDPACVLVRKLFDELSSGAERMAFADEPRAGRIIGKLERFIVVILMLTGQASAIGFVLTAKSIARFKQFEAQGFAERYLVGTLASTAFAIFTALVLWKLR